MMEAVRTSETSVNNHFTRQCIPEDNSEHQENSNLKHLHGDLSQISAKPTNTKPTS
jgi:hypothetical protein